MDSDAHNAARGSPHVGPEFSNGDATHREGLGARDGMNLPRSPRARPDASCRLPCALHAAAVTALLAAALGIVAGGCRRAEETPGRAESVGWPPFAHAPIDTPLVLTASFGEYRSGHFHAGLDFSTQQAVGRPVYAPASGWVRRARASGVGYGRGLYFQADDG